MVDYVSAIVGKIIQGYLYIKKNKVNGIFKKIDCRTPEILVLKKMGLYLFI